MINFNGLGSAAAAAAGAYNAPMYHVAPYQQQPPMWAGNGGGGAGGGAGYPQQGQGQHVQFVFQAVVQPQQQGNGAAAAAAEPNPKKRVLKDTSKDPATKTSTVMNQEARATQRSTAIFDKRAATEVDNLLAEVVTESEIEAPTNGEQAAMAKLIARFAFS